jgi:predicted secreted protein
MAGCGWLIPKPSLETREGEPIEIRLPANFSTGYRWVLDPPQQSGCVLSENYLPDSDTKRAGAPGTQSFQMLFSRDGRFNLRFSYRRLWESSSIPPAQTTNLVILVTSKKASPSFIEALFSTNSPSTIPQPEEDQPSATTRNVELRKTR